MINGFKVITLCGSTRFKDEFIEVQKRLTLEGNIVISVGLFGHSGDEEVWNEGVKEMLDRQHLAKIDLADEIFVINVGGYIGESTRRDIAYAKCKHKAVSYLENKLKYGVMGFYSALGKLHESGRLSDEDYKKAYDENEKRLWLAVDEYNACIGPWPYLWKNIDPVVCGILWPRTFLSNIDACDLKFLYDFDSVYEVRIKGKGCNLVEQAQSIVNIAKRDYMDQLLSSKKVVITLFFPFHESEEQIPIYNSVCDKLTVLFADLESNNVDMHLQARRSNKETELELWIVYGEQK